MSRMRGISLSAFSTLRKQANLSLANIASEFGIAPSEAASWDGGEKVPPAHIIQSLKMIAQFEGNRPAARLTENIAMLGDKPGSGIKVLSFFTGGGGLDLGFESAGFETVYATDIDPDSCRTLEANRGGLLGAALAVECADIRALDPATLPPDIDLVIGGPPCQSFSASGRRAGGAAGRLDQRGNLFQAYCSVIKAAQPKAFVFENVRGIMATNHGDDWKAIIAAFADLGYKISYRLLDALDYGAPQQRERMFLVGHRMDDDFLFPQPTHGPDSFDGLPHQTAGRALAGIIEDEDVGQLTLNSGKYAHLLPLVPPGQNYLHFTAKRGYPKPVFAYRSRFSDFLYKADPEAPIKTLIASPGKYTGPLHWDNRYFSLKEYKRLQGFPDDFKFFGTRESIIRQIGNSVSPHIARQIALAVAAQIFGARTDIKLLAKDQKLSFDRRKGAKAQSTRAMHAAVAKDKTSTIQNAFQPHDYEALIVPNDLSGTRPNAKSVMDEDGPLLVVRADDSGAPFARMVIDIDPGSAPLRLTVEASGQSPATIQTMWNAVDDWVRRCSDFHSLFELYGHFTEPHPVFAITSFEAISNHPIAAFASHAADFTNCSRYFSKQHLVSLFSDVLETDSFADIARYLRQYRFDIRSHETNIAIGSADYMVAYPFTLPSRRQMNFSVRTIAEAAE